MKIDKDLFISYAHIDNKPLSEEQKGWITQFHETLEATLSQRLGSQARIWRDDKLQGNDVFADEICDQFARVAVLVSVLTPRYLKSDWCTKEITEFCDRAEQSGGMVVANKARIFKVMKLPVDTQESLPSVVKDILGYEFFTFENETAVELNPNLGDKFKQAFQLKVMLLSADIAQMIDQLAADSPAGESAEPKPTVYLAECSRDRRENRDLLEGDLKRHGYTVLPDRQLPNDEEDYVQAVEGLLERCALAVHLVGGSGGVVPDGPSQKSIVVLQNELAAKRSQSNALPRVIWLPEDTASEQAPHQAFIDALHQDPQAQLGADLLTGDLEDLKAAIHSALKKQEKPAPKASEEQAAGDDGAKLIYLLCNEKDRKARSPVRKFCKAQGFEVATPAFTGDAGEIREVHRRLLSTCDAVILFYGAGDEAWKRTMDTDLKKMPGYRGGRPLLASYTYLAGPMTDDKEEIIDDEEPNLIDGMDDFSEEAMAAFVQAMNAGETTS